jgi:hypothetical protein
MNDTLVPQKEVYLEERIFLEDEIEGYGIAYASTPDGSGWSALKNFERYDEKELKNQLKQIISNHLIRKGVDVLRSLRESHPFVEPNIRIRTGEVAPSSLSFSNNPTPTYLEFHADEELNRINIRYVGEKRGGIIECILDLSIEKLPPRDGT